MNSLHGSANAIGGQNCINKARWGVTHPDDMHFEDAAPGIKFALGENPKQSNAGDRSTTRYPQTRMGVEALIRDRFVAAREYAAAWRAFEDGGRKGVAPRRDLELEALAEMLSGKRLVHCHSYRQDEILMLCRVAKEFGFTIGTFQHVLEGYKVADEIKAARARRLVVLRLVGVQGRGAGRDPAERPDHARRRRRRQLQLRLRRARAPHEHRGGEGREVRRPRRRPRPSSSSR